MALGEAGFAEDTAPADALVAVRRADGGWAVGETLRAARLAAGKVQGRRTSTQLSWPLEVPPGAWDLTLRTTWVEPAYLEPDAAWCEPGGEPAGPLANGGAFGGKVDSPVAAAARELATRHGRPCGSCSPGRTPSGAARSAPQWRPASVATAPESCGRFGRLGWPRRLPGWPPG